MSMVSDRKMEKLVTDRGMEKLSGIRKACFRSPDSVYFCPQEKTLLGCTTVAAHLTAGIGKFKLIFVTFGEEVLTLAKSRSS